MRPLIPVFGVDGAPEIRLASNDVRRWLASVTLRVFSIVSILFNLISTVHGKKKKKREARKKKTKG